MNKFLNLAGLAYLWSKIVDELDSKANKSHTHSEYLTESDVSSTYAKKTDIASINITSITDAEIDDICM